MVAVVMDSAGNLPPELARELGITVVPMYLKLGDTVYRDGVDLTPGDLYQRLLRSRETASTSTPSPGDYLEAFDAAGQPEVVCVTVAAGLSSSHQQATLAAERFPGRVAVVDSGNASMGEGFVGIEAARLAARGGSLDEVAEMAREVASRASLIATVDTFEFLRKSGRVTKLQAYAATMLDIKPVFRFRSGEIVPVARSRTRRRSLARVVDETVSTVAERPVHLAGFHAAAAGDAAEVISRIGEAARVLESFIVEVTPVIGAHTGPGLVGTAFFTEASTPADPSP
jgi:DegV family protein with EDD domain